MRSTSTFVAIAAIAATSSFAASTDSFLEARDYANELEARTFSLHPSRWGKNKAEVAAMNSKKWGNKVEKIKQDVGAAERRDFDEELEARTVSIHPSRWGKSKAEVAAMNSKKWGNKVEKIKQDVGAAERRDLEALDARDIDDQLEARTFSLHPTRWGKSKAEVAAMNSKKWGNKVEKIKQDVGAAERRDFDEELEARDFDEELEARDFDEELEARDFDEELEARDFDEELEARTVSLHPSRWGKSKAEVAVSQKKKWDKKLSKAQGGATGESAPPAAAERRDLEDDLEARDFDEDLEARTVSLHPSRWGKSKAEVAVSQKKKWDKKLAKAQGGATGESAPPTAAERRSIDEDFEELLSRDLYELEDLD